MVKNWRQLRSLVRTWQPDIVHAHTAGRYAWHAHLSGFHPYVVSVWGSDVLLRRDAAQARFWTRRALSHADLVTAVSPIMGQAAVAKGARHDRVELVHHGVDRRTFHPAAPALATAPDPYVFSPRALTPIYNHETILRAVAALPSRPRIVVSDLGADPDYRNKIVQLASGLGISQQLQIRRDLSERDLAALYQRASVVASAATSDSMPLSLLEAMACGTAIVAGDLPPIREAIGDLVPEFLVPPRDVDAMAIAIGSALTLPHTQRQELRDRLTSRAFELADYDSHMLRMEQLYTRLANRSR